MNLRDLHYFVVLAEVAHFGEAAKRCFVSQPTLSMQIKKLEETLGVVLFERTNKQVLLTDEGRALLGRAKEILNLANEMKELAKQSHDPFSGELHLGVIPTVAPYLLPLIMPLMNTHFPHLKIWLVEEQTHRLNDKLEAGQLDAVIMAQPIPYSFRSQNLYDEEFYFACNVNHPLAKAKHLSIKELAGQPIMLLEEGHCLREQAMAICQMAKTNEFADYTATSLETLRLMVQAGRGVTLMPSLATRVQTSDEIKFIPFLAPAPARTIALFWRSGSPRVQCMQAIAQLISDTVLNLR